MKIEQAIVGGTVQSFKKGFMDRYSFKEYYDKNKPVVFFGVEGRQDLYENHMGYKIFLPTTPDELHILKNLTNHNKTFIAWNDIDFLKQFNGIRVKEEIIELKDYSIFKPNTLGDKIYYYSGFKDGWSGRWGEEIIDEIQKNISFEIITTKHKTQKEYFDINFLKSQFYDNTFLNINLSKQNGMTTVHEMALMGRKTIILNKNHPYKYKSLINCDSIENIIDTINKESKKIGTLQESINNHTSKDEWLNINYWI